MKRIYSIGSFNKFASTSQSISRFQSAVIKSSGGKSSRKTIEVKTHYKPSSNSVIVDVDEYTKSGHKHRNYTLNGVSSSLYKKIESLISKGRWGMFFGLVNKHRDKE